MNVGLLLKKAKEKIPALDAEVILCEVLGGKDKSYLVAHDDEEVSALVEEKFFELVSRREKGEPVAYILGKKEFFAREFLVDKNVLIPRPESEMIVEIAKKLDVSRILDVGTGSGVLAISLALEIPKAEVFGVDIAEEALALARKNAERLGAEISFSRSNLLESVDGQFDLIVANLPYVDRDWDFLSKELEFEPEIALFAEDRGLYLIKKLIEQVRGRTKYLILEADPLQHEEIEKYCEKFGMKVLEKAGFVLLVKVEGGAAEEKNEDYDNGDAEDDWGIDFFWADFPVVFCEGGIDFIEHEEDDCEDCGELGDNES